MNESVVSASRTGIAAGYGPGERPSIGNPIITWSNTSMWSDPISSTARANLSTASGPSRYDTLGNSTESFMASLRPLALHVQVGRHGHELLRLPRPELAHARVAG